jgi:hypothetical protein
MKIETVTPLFHGADFSTCCGVRCIHFFHWLLHKTRICHGVILRAVCKKGCELKKNLKNFFPTEFLIFDLIFFLDFGFRLMTFWFRFLVCVQSNLPIATPPNLQHLSICNRFFQSRRKGYTFAHGPTSKIATLRNCNMQQHISSLLTCCSASIIATVTHVKLRKCLMCLDIVFVFELPAIVEGNQSWLIQLKRLERI